MSRFVGPALPAHLKEKDDSDDDGTAIKPVLPPGWKNAEVIGSVLPSQSAKKRSHNEGENKTGSLDKSNKSARMDKSKDSNRTKVIGPTLPPAPSNTKRDKKPIDSSLPNQRSSNRSKISDNTNSGSDDDEFTIGPLPPSGNYIEVEESRHQKTLQIPEGSNGPQREEWISSLPENSSVAQKLGFGKSMTSFASKLVSIKEIEPVDHDNELDKVVEEYNKATRPEPLVDMHKKKTKDKKKMEEPTRKLFDFNPEEDMKVRQLDSQQTKAIMEKAKLLNSRFANPRGQNKFL